MLYGKNPTYWKVIMDPKSNHYDREEYTSKLDSIKANLPENYIAYVCVIQPDDIIDTFFTVKDWDTVYSFNLIHDVYVISIDDIDNTERKGDCRSAPKKLDMATHNFPLVMSQEDFQTEFGNRIATEFSYNAASTREITSFLDDHRVVYAINRDNDKVYLITVESLVCNHHTFYLLEDDLTLHPVDVIVQLGAGQQLTKTIQGIDNTVEESDCQPGSKNLDMVDLSITREDFETKYGGRIKDTPNLHELSEEELSTMLHKAIDDGHVVLSYCPHNPFGYVQLDHISKELINSWESEITENPLHLLCGIVYIMEKGFEFEPVSENSKCIHQLELHEDMKVDEFTQVTRVPGGWLYHVLHLNDNHQQQMITGTTTFVPFNNEFNQAHLTGCALCGK